MISEERKDELRSKARNGMGVWVTSPEEQDFVKGFMAGGVDCAVEGCLQRPLAGSSLCSLCFEDYCESDCCDTEEDYVKDVIFGGTDIGPHFNQELADAVVSAHLCQCDYLTILRVVGCQCGGI